MKNVAVFTEGAFALFFRPHLGGSDSSRVPTPGNLPSKAKKMLMPGGGRWAHLELTDALGYYCIRPQQQQQHTNKQKPSIEF